MAEQFVNNFATTVASPALTSGASSLTVASRSGAPSTGPFRIVIDNEVIIATGSLTTTTWAITRAQEGTSAASHAIGAAVNHYLTAGMLSAMVSLPTDPGFTDSVKRAYLRRRGNTAGAIEWGYHYREDERIWNIIADGGADPNSPGNTTLVTQAILDGISSGLDIYVPPNDWVVDNSSGPLDLDGQQLFGRGFSTSIAVLKQTGKYFYNDDLFRISLDKGGVRDLEMTMNCPSTVSAGGTQTLSAASSNFSFTVSSTSTFENAGTNTYVAVEGDGDNCQAIAFTYTSVDATHFLGCNWFKGRAPQYSQPFANGLSVQGYPRRGSAIRVINDAANWSLVNLNCVNFHDQYSVGDDYQLHSAVVNYVAATDAVTWVSGDTFELLNPGAATGAMTGSPFWWGLYVAIYGAGGTAPDTPALGSKKPGVRVKTYTDNKHLVLEDGSKLPGTHTTVTATKNDVTGAVMVWGNAAITQGGLGGGSYGTFHRLFGDDAGRHALAIHTNFDHADLGNFKVASWRFGSQYGQAGFMNRGSGVQGAGLKINKFNYGYDVGNQTPNGPNGNDTTNFNVSDIASEAAFAGNYRWGYQAICKFNGTTLGQVKAQCGATMRDAAFILTDLSDHVSINGMFIGGFGPTDGSRMKGAFWLQNSDDIYIDGVHTSIGSAFKAFLAIGPSCNAIRLGPGNMGAYSNMESLFRNVDIDGTTLAVPATYQYFNPGVIPSGVLPAYWISPPLTNGSTATAWRFTMSKGASLELDLLAYGQMAADPWQRRTRVIITRANSNTADAVVNVLEDTDVGSVVTTVPTFTFTLSHTSPYGFVAVNLVNNSGGSVSGQINGRARGNPLELEMANANAGIGVDFAS